MSKAKSFSISKKVVWEAYRRVKASKGAAGVDGQSIKDFEVDLKDNLYKIWNPLPTRIGLQTNQSLKFSSCLYLFEAKSRKGCDIIILRGGSRAVLSHGKRNKARYLKIWEIVKITQPSQDLR